MRLVSIFICTTIIREVSRKSPEAFNRFGASFCMSQTKIIYCFDCEKQVNEGECEGHKKAWGWKYDGHLDLGDEVNA